MGGGEKKKGKVVGVVDRGWVDGCDGSCSFGLLGWVQEGKGRDFTYGGILSR